MKNFCVFGIIVVLLWMTVLMQGCSTMQGVGSLVQGIGTDISGASVAIKNEIGK